MAIIRLTWDKFVDLNRDNSNEHSVMYSILNDTAITNKLQSLDALFNTKYNISSCYELMFSTVLSIFERNSHYKDMVIWVSSFALDERKIIRVKNIISNYVNFLYKVVNEDGLARDIVRARNYSDNSSTNVEDKNFFSETPQERLQNFDEAINYASNLSKNENETTGTSSGNERETETGKSYEEAVKSLRLVFNEDLLDYLAKLPMIIYSEYALDSRPAFELQLEWRKALKDVYKIIYARR